MLNSPIQVAITLGTRPEAIKLAPVIQLFQNSPDFNTLVILTGQHREMVAQVMKLFNIIPNQDLAIMQTRQTLTDIMCRSLQGLEELFVQLQPQLVLVQGDTSTAFAAALSAFYQKIPVGHIEAGLRTNDLFNPYPEEANRRLISQIAQLHFAPTTLAMENLQKSGVVGEVHQTGNTVIDALLKVAKSQPQCQINGLDWGKYRVILATVHRRENWGEPLKEIAEGFLQILEKFPDTALVLPLHKNPTVREPLKVILGSHPRIFLEEPFDYSELVGAIQNCYLILTDSGGLQEEAPSLGKPVLVLRETTERPEAIMAGTAKLVGTNTSNIVPATAELLSDISKYEKMAMAINPFGDGYASERIINIVQSYFS
ncbi:MAG: UDP-N-acetylglucosamine 2-epimerase (non-hydrolyzing) [Cyanobacteria bacterium P01_H01_bin.35]